MPTPEARAREREVIDLVVTAMASATGLQVDMLGYPDDEAGFPECLTVDAVISVSDGQTTQRWALDVMNLSWDNRLIPADQDLRDRIEQELQDVAAAHGRDLTVLYTPPVGAADRGEDYLREVVEYATRVCLRDSHAHPFDGDPGTQVIATDPAAAAPHVTLVVGLAQSTDIRQQVIDTMVGPLVKKLESQLRRAHGLGYPTMLAIDQVGPPSMLGNNWLASPATVGQLVAQTVVHHEHSGGPHVLDLAVLVSHDPSTGPAVAPVFSGWPMGPAP
jgi:hypothetical protein